MYLFCSREFCRRFLDPYANEYLDSDWGHTIISIFVFAMLQIILIINRQQSSSIDLVFSFFSFFLFFFYFLFFGIFLSLHLLIVFHRPG